MEAAKRGYIAYTNCTAALAEVVPFLGKYPHPRHQPAQLGFPHHRRSRLPDRDRLGHLCHRNGPRAAVPTRRHGTPSAMQPLIRDGNMTTDPNEVSALVPFGAHKGYGLSLINELVGGFIGGSLPTLRSREIPEGEKRTPAFYFQVIHPDAINGGAFAKGRNQTSNVKAVIEDILGHGNESCLLPGQLEARWAAARRSKPAAYSSRLPKLKPSMKLPKNAARHPGTSILQSRVNGPGKFGRSKYTPF